MKEKKLSDRQQEKWDALMEQMKVELDEIEKNWHPRATFDSAADRPYQELYRKYAPQFQAIEEEKE